MKPIGFKKEWHRVAVLGLLGIMVPAAANADSGNISATDKYAWSEDAGWANFRPTHGGVTVSSTHLSGYAWLKNLGWVKLGSDSGGPYANTNATNWGVNHDGAGNLSGYAWSENAGWINFDPSHSQVTINLTTGDFTGYAWGENIGYVHFSNAAPAYKVSLVLGSDSDGDGTPDSSDGCLNDASKTAPGQCGCGISDIMNACGTCGPAPAEVCDGADNNCNGQIDEGVKNACGGCGAASDADADGTPDCNDLCPNDPNKTAPGADGCMAQGTDILPQAPVTTQPRSSVTVTFSVVTSAGTVSATPTTASSPPSNYKLVGVSTYDISFTGEYTGPVTVCINYNQTAVSNESQLKLFHRGGTGWQNITSSLDTVNNWVCGQSSTLSPFALGEPVADTDGDGVADSTDNCPTISNVSQADADGDGAGDACDAFPNNPQETTDTDGDGVGDHSDAYPNDPTRWEATAPQYQVPVGSGLWMIPSVLTGLYFLRRRKRG